MLLPFMHAPAQCIMHISSSAAPSKLLSAFSYHCNGGGRCEISQLCHVRAGHMHPPFFAIMNEIQEGLRYMFQTKSKYVCLISGTGHSGGSRHWLWLSAQYLAASDAEHPSHNGRIPYVAD